MNWIEIAGPSSVGKSTLLKKLSAQRSAKNQEWVLPHEAIIEIAKNRKNNSYKGVKNKLKHVLLKSEFFSDRQNIFAQKLMQVSKRNEKALRNYIFLMEPYLEKIVEENKDAMFKVKMINWYQGILKNAAIIDTYGYEKTVIFDEGLFNNNKNGFVELDKTEKWLLPNAVLFCGLNIQENFERIKNRERIMPYYRGLTDEALYEEIKKYWHKNELKIEKIKSLNIPVLEVSLEKIDEDLVAEVNKFIMTHIETHATK